jgi:hypothetical protein
VIQSGIAAELGSMRQGAGTARSIPATQPQMQINDHQEPLHLGAVTATGPYGARHSLPWQCAGSTQSPTLLCLSAASLAKCDCRRVAHVISSRGDAMCDTV